MNKKSGTALLLLSALLLPLCGCWSYLNLNELAVVMGVAVDSGPGNRGYTVTYELLDASAPVDQQSPSTRLVEAEGATLLDASRSAQRKLAGRLYFGDAQALILSRSVAERESLRDLTDWFLREAECRETMAVAVSRGDTAAELFDTQSPDSAIAAYAFRRTVESDRLYTSSAAEAELYQVYGILRSEGRDLALPALRRVENAGGAAGETDGTALFRGDRLAGFLTPEESKYLLFATDRTEGGVLLFSSEPGGPEDSSLRILKNDTRRSFSYENGVLRLRVETDTSVSLSEYARPLDALDQSAADALEKTAAAGLEKKIGEIIRTVQTRYGADVFGFGELLRKENPRLWRELGGDWDRLFPSLEVEIRSSVRLSLASSLQRT